MPVVPDYIAYWPLNGTAQDETGTYVATIPQSITFEYDSKLDAVVSRTNIFDDDYDFNINDSFSFRTLCFWFKVPPGGYSTSNTPDRTDMSFSFSDRGGQTFPSHACEFRTGYAGYTWSMDIASLSYFRTNATIPEGWHHFTIVILSSTTGALYVDAQSKPITQSATISGSYIALTDIVDGCMTEGLYAHVRLYDRVLLQSEIHDIYVDEGLKPRCSIATSTTISVAVSNNICNMSSLASIYAKAEYIPRAEIKTKASIYAKPDYNFGEYVYRLTKGTPLTDAEISNNFKKSKVYKTMKPVVQGGVVTNYRSGVLYLGDVTVDGSGNITGTGDLYALEEGYSLSEKVVVT